MCVNKCETVNCRWPTLFLKNILFGVKVILVSEIFLRYVIVSSISNPKYNANCSHPCCLTLVDITFYPVWSHNTESKEGKKLSEVWRG